MNVIIVIGYPAAGKSTYISQIQGPGDAVVEPGNIARELAHTTHRVHDKSLDDKILRRIKNIIDRNERVIISCPRSKDVVESLIEYVGWENLEVHVLDVPLSVCRARYNTRSDVKDRGISFDEVLRKDNAMGLGEMMKKFVSLARQNPHVKIFQ